MITQSFNSYREGRGRGGGDGTAWGALLSHGSSLGVHHDLTQAQPILPFPDAGCRSMKLQKGPYQRLPKGSPSQAFGVTLLLNAQLLWARKSVFLAETKRTLKSHHFPSTPGTGRKDL